MTSKHPYTKADFCCLERFEAQRDGADGDVRIAHDADGFHLIVPSVRVLLGYALHAFVTITHCPWCGTALDAECDPAVDEDEWEPTDPGRQWRPLQYGTLVTYLGKGSIRTSVKRYPGGTWVDDAGTDVDPSVPVVTFPLANVTHILVRS